MKRFLLTLCALCATTLVWAATWTDPETGITWSYTISGGNAAIESGEFTEPAVSSLISGNLVIPEQINGYNVNRIGSFAFYNCSGLTSVIIPSCVKSLGRHVFRYCSGLTYVEFPGVITFEDHAIFEHCTSLSSISLPEGLKIIPEWTFNGCTNLKTITISSHITSIKEQAFSNCASLKIEVDEGNLNYASRDGALFNKAMTTLIRAPGDVSSYVIPSSVTTIDNHAFRGNTKLELVTIPSSVTSIGDYAFQDCSGLTSVTIPEGVTSIGDYTFRGCSGVTSVTIPDSVTSIGDYAFCICSGLTSVIIPEGVTSIGSSAFYGCSGLTSITIPSSVTSIGSWAFINCSSSLEVFFAGAVPEGYANSSLSGKKISYPKEFAPQWEAVISAINRLPLIDVIVTANVTVSAEMTTPQTMKVTYSVASDLPKVKVRAVAFADGVRSFAKIVPVKNGENVPNGGEVASNTKYTFIWNVFEDWDTDLSKVAIEILVQEGELLPQELITIPAVGENKAMTITRNTITTKMAFNALLWCIAEGDEALTIENGVVKTSGKQIASGTSVTTDENSNHSVSTLLNYLYGKMGYKVLAGDDLTYAKAATRLGLLSLRINQHAIKIEE